MPNYVHNEILIFMGVSNFSYPEEAGSLLKLRPHISQPMLPSDVFYFLTYLDYVYVSRTTKKDRTTHNYKMKDKNRDNYERIE